MHVQDDIVSSFREAQSKLVVQTADLPLGTLAGMVDTRAIDLEPGFQRRERWSTEKQAALIESFLLNVPVPPVYLAEEMDGTYTAIDGKQRLRAIADFISGKFALRSMERLRSAEGVRFGDLPSEVVNSLRLRPYLRVVTLLKQTDPLLKYEVFLRLNRGGEALNAQEIRNVAFRGDFNDRIYILSENHFLRHQLKIENTRSAAYKEMSDAEFVLRFLTLRERFENFSGSLIREMDDFMRRKQKASSEEIEKLSHLFVDAIGRCERIWGNLAFRRPEGQGWRDQTLAGMYDAQMIAASEVTEEVVEKAESSKPQVKHATRQLFSDPEFDKAVRTGTNTPQRIRYRIGKMRELLEAV
ncbi:DUF262 domain-containing protein [Aquibium sp. LZ166]|uniref:DUF262 domain-containing protein n=1 Tax=Aquibium pacificus TaxID=3153579 RepID=A0ABV3SQR0_9HYPH